MKCIIFGAGSDLGVHIDGASLGPIQLMNDLKSFFNGQTILLKQDDAIIKSKNLSDRRKNEYEIDKFNTKLYNTILENTKEECFPITIGGDHSVSVASALASVKKNENIGIIWISSHADYNTFQTTVSGNINGMSLAAINGYKNHELRYFHDGGIIQPVRSVIYGTRDIDDWEKDNIKYSNVNIITDKDIKDKGIEATLEEAFKIALEKNDGIHVCFNLDIIDPDTAPGVDVPVFDGISEDDAMKINSIIIKHIDEVVSFDLMEFNPLRDQNRKTEQIALNILAQIIRASDTKQKYVRKKY